MAARGLRISFARGLRAVRRGVKYRRLLERQIGARAPVNLRQQPEQRGGPCTSHEPTTSESKRHTPTSECF